MVPGPIVGDEVRFARPFGFGRRGARVVGNPKRERPDGQRGSSGGGAHQSARPGEVSGGNCCPSRRRWSKASNDSRRDRDDPRDAGEASCATYRSSRCRSASARSADFQIVRIFRFYAAASIRWCQLSHTRLAITPFPVKSLHFQGDRPFNPRDAGLPGVICREPANASGARATGSDRQRALASREAAFGERAPVRTTETAAGLTADRSVEGNAEGFGSKPIGSARSRRPGKGRVCRCYRIPASTAVR